MALKDKLNWFAVIDEALWGDTLEVNRYLTSISIMVAAIGGALLGVDSVFGSEIGRNPVAAVGALILMWGICVAETVMCSRSIKTTILRSLMLLVAFPLVFGFGILASIIVMIVIAIWLILLFASGFLRAGLSSGSGSSSGSGHSSDNDDSEVLDFGMGNQVKGKSSFDGNTFYGDDGSRYTRTGYDSWSKEE